MARVLLVENDSLLAATLKKLLERESYQVLHATTLARAHQLLEQEGFDGVIVDRVLDDGDGFELVELIAEVSPSTRFLFLSQKGSVEERVRGLRAGADEYLAKPFSLEELRLKLQKLFLYQKKPTVSYLEFDGVKLYPETGQLRLRDGYQRQLRRREAQILSCLFRYQGSIVSRQMMIDEVWKTQTAIPTSETLDVYIRRLRMALGSQSGIIKTVRGFGYSLADGE